MRSESAPHPPASASHTTGTALTRLKRVGGRLLAIILILPVAGVLYQAIGTAIDDRTQPFPGSLVDIGGYRLYLNCMGENADQRPTVILETGLGGGATSADWAWIQPELAKTTRVCSYDRAGLGWSDRSPQPRDAQHIAGELHTLLQNAHVSGPYVLAGWSYGGLYVRAYASQYPEDVAGIVLIDSSSPGQCTSTPAWQAVCSSSDRTFSEGPILARLGVMRVMDLFQPAFDLPTTQSEKRLASLAATKDWDALKAEYLAGSATDKEVLSSKSLGAVPLFVVTATEHGAAPEVEQLWQAWQAGYTALSTNSFQRVVHGATHESLVLDPAGSKASVEAILQVVEAAQTGERLRP